MFYLLKTCCKLLLIVIEYADLSIVFLVPNTRYVVTVYYSRPTNELLINNILEQSLC